MEYNKNDFMKMVREKKKIGSFSSGMDWNLGFFTGLNFFLFMMTLANVYGLWMPALLFVYWFGENVVVWKKEETKITWFVCAGVFVALGCNLAGAPILLVLQMWDKKNLVCECRWLDDLIMSLGDWDKTIFSCVSPWCGENSQLGDITKNVSELIEGWKESAKFGFEVNGKKLRDLDIEEAYNKIEDRPVLSPHEVRESYVALAERMRWGIMAIISVFCYICLGGVGLFFVALSVLAMEFEDAPAIVIDRTKTGYKFSDGVYRIGVLAAGFEYDRGIGVSYGGVLHVPYHVSRGKDILIGPVRHTPYLVSVDEDLVTYGGPPKITEIQDDEEVFVNCETDESRTSYLVKAETSIIKKVISWAGVTKPGESGSPVVVRRDGRIHLVGLAGRYVKDKEGVTEFSNIKPRVATDFGKERVVMHPGSGKTFKIIPDMIQEYLEKSGKRVLVTGPTRVVCRELYNALKKRGIKVGLNIKDMPGERNEGAPVQVAAHRSALGMLVKKSRALRNLGFVLIDEAHFDDASTRLLRDYGDYLVDRGLKVAEFSATLDDECARGSNYGINDKEIKMNNVIGTVLERLEMGEKVMVFVPSLTCKIAVELINAVKGTRVVQLSRKNFSSAVRDVNDENTRLIISTDISECGINVNDLDTVVDVGLKFTHVREGNVIYGMEIGISESSRVQRRGRVGRTKPGNYLFVDTKHRQVESVADYDRKVMGTGRRWSRVSNEWGIMFSDAQFAKWLEDDIPPLAVSVKYGRTGDERPRNEREKEIQDLKKGETFYDGCHEQCGKCRGKYKWYDERIHDMLYK